MERQEIKSGPLVVSRTEDGFRVYAVRDRFTLYAVKDGTCTCPDFAARSDIACEHIQAAGRFEAMTNGSRDTGADTKGAGAMEHDNNAEAQIVLKRSVSPDGRIDSLSVEVGFPADNLSVAEIKARAEKALAIQHEITGRFLNGASKGNGASVGSGVSVPASGRNGNDDGTLPAEVLYVGGMNGRFGRRLFLVIRADDRNLRVYGSPKQLAEHLLAAGIVGYDGRINEGMELKVPCRVVTKPSDDGRYLNVERLLPVPGNGRNGR